MLEVPASAGGRISVVWEPSKDQAFAGVPAPNATKRAIRIGVGPIRPERPSWREPPIVESQKFCGPRVAVPEVWRKGMGDLVKYRDLARSAMWAEVQLVFVTQT